MIDAVYSALMNIGVYVDAYNLYYGGRALCGRNKPGWRWLDVRGLAADLVKRRRSWRGSDVTRVVYCTARVSPQHNQSGHADQDVYLKALLASRSVDVIEYGTFVNRVRTSPLATADERGRPVLARPSELVMVQDSAGSLVRDAFFRISHAQWEEKGSDVNVATHLLTDVLDKVVDAAIVITNDSDLQLPLTLSRRRVPVGLVNPSKNQTAGALKGERTSGVGNHWWLRLQANDFFAHQLRNPIGDLSRPAGW